LNAEIDGHVQKAFFSSSGGEERVLKHSSWNVSEIGYALGFNETTHFNNFFKKHVELSPLRFRNACSVGPVRRG
jgi:AraC-like DNA-binding protein